jgi:polysaccharide biosynthesis transport protein
MPEVMSTNEVSLNSIFGILRRRRSAVFAGMILVIAAAALYAFLKADSYRADVLMSLEPAAAQDYLNSADPSTRVNVQERLWLIRENLYSPALLETVISEFGLDSTTRSSEQDAWNRLVHNTRERLSATLKYLQLSNGSAPSAEMKKEQELERAKARIKIQVEAADAFSIGFEGSDRSQVAAVANRIAELLVQHTSRASEQRAGSAATFLEAEVERVKATLDQQRNRIHGYQQSATDQLPAQLGSNMKMLEMLEEQSMAKQEQISDDQARRASVAEEMKELASQGVLDKAPAPSAADTKIEDLRARLKELNSKYTPQHPEVKATEAELKEAEATRPADPPKVSADPSPAHLRYMQLKAEQEAIDRRLASSQQQYRTLAPDIANYRRKVQATPQHERTLAELTREYDETRVQYQSLLEKQNRAQLEERLEKNVQSTMFRIVRPAQFPLEPFAPKRARILLLSVLGGLGLGLFAAMFFEYRDTTYRSAEDFRGSSKLPVIALIPELNKAQPRLLGRSSHSRDSRTLPIAKQAVDAVQEIVTIHDPRSVASEQYGFVTLQLRHLLTGKACQVVAVTSPAGGEGKTVTSINLAVMLSRTGSGRVLLVECDLRKPSVGTYLGLAHSSGVGDLLQRSEETPVEPYLHQVGQLSVLLGGNPLSDPLEVLSSDRTRLLLDRLRKNFQFIVLDLPPILPVADSRVMADLSDGVVLVVRAGQTRRELLQHALERFPVPNILGVVLNDVQLQNSGYSKAYEYYARGYVAESERRMATQR